MKIGCAPSTVTNELRRGTPARKSNKGKAPGYSPKLGEAVYRANRAPERQNRSILVVLFPEDEASSTLEIGTPVFVVVVNIDKMSVEAILQTFILEYQACKIISQMNASDSDGSPGNKVAHPVPVVEDTRSTCHCRLGAKILASSKIVRSWMMVSLFCAISTTSWKRLFRK